MLDMRTLSPPITDASSKSASKVTATLIAADSPGSAFASCPTAQAVVRIRDNIRKSAVIPVRRRVSSLRAGGLWAEPAFIKNINDFTPELETTCKLHELASIIHMCQMILTFLAANVKPQSKTIQEMDNGGL